MDTMLQNKQIENNVIFNINLKDAEKTAIIKSRIVHSTLKQRLVPKEGECKICGLLDKRFLIASHIKPWAQSNNQERLDLDNVLLLCPHHDAVFDKGDITFDENGTLLISSELSLESKALLNLIEGKKVIVSNKNSDKPKMKDGKSGAEYMMAPLRDIFEKLAATYTYNANTEEIIMQLNDSILTVKIEGKKMIKVTDYTSMEVI